jgi:hypothetical protein
MKTAILVNGEFREFDISIKSWKFLQELDCDVFVSTWKKCIQYSKNINFYLEEDITEESIRKHIPNATISILDVKDFDFSSDSEYHNGKQTFHWKNCLKLMKESGNSYDQIMLIRPDDYLFYQPSYTTFHKLNDKDLIYGLTRIIISPQGDYFLADYFFFGNYEPMAKMIETLPNEMPDNIHTALPKHIQSIGLDVKQINQFDMCLVRPTMRGVQEINRQVLQDKWEEWGNNMFNKI